jgi:hypothetical protein
MSPCEGDGDIEQEDAQGYFLLLGQIVTSHGTPSAAIMMPLHYSSVWH